MKVSNINENVGGAILTVALGSVSPNRDCSTRLGTGLADHYDRRALVRARPPKVGKASIAHSAKDGEAADRLSDWTLLLVRFEQGD